LVFLTWQQSDGYPGTGQVLIFGYPVSKLCTHDSPNFFAQTWILLSLQYTQWQFGQFWPLGSQKKKWLNKFLFGKVEKQSSMLMRMLSAKFGSTEET